MIVLRYIWGFLFWILAFGALLALLTIFPIVSEDWRVYSWLFLGMVAYLALMGISSAFFEQNLKFFRTFTHELTHTIFTILSFKRVRAFQATSHQGGEIHVVGGGNMLIVLSPYCIPIFTILFLLLQPLFQTQYLPYLQFIIGLTYLFHLHTNWLQVGFRQTDITKYPLLTSFGFILFFQLLFLGIVLLHYQEGWRAFIAFPKMMYEKLMLALEVLMAYSE